MGEIDFDERAAALRARIAALDPRIDDDPEEMRRMGYRVVDEIVARLASARERETGRTAGRAEMEALLREPLPEGRVAFDRLLEDYREKILRYSFDLAHPRFFAYIPSSPTYVAILADALAAAANLFLGNWQEGAAAAEVEILVIDWFRQMIGLEAPEAGGLLTSGGSAANLTALAVARHALLADETAGAVIYASDQAHSSVERAARLLGFRPGQLARLPTDARFRLEIAELERRIAEDQRGGRRPFCVVANGGATSTGAVDPLAAAAAVCRRHGLWFHVDAAYGGFAVLAERGRQLLGGIERADSVTLDPHKWFYTPFEAGCVLFREARQARAVFHLLHDYLQDMPREVEKVNFYDYGIQLTRCFRALKLWMALRCYGVETYRALVERSLDLGALAALRLRRSSRFEIFDEPQLSVVCFRYVPAGLTPGEADDEVRLDRLNAELVERVVASGEAVLSSTRLRGRLAIRLCALNHRTRAEDVEHAVELVERLGNELA